MVIVLENTTSAHEKRLLDKVDGDRLMAATAAIAKNVRLSGTAEELDSFHWVEEQLRAYGYKTQLVHHDAYISLPGSARLMVEVPAQEEIECITHAFNVSSPKDGLSGELVYLASLDELDHKDVAGKITLTPGMASWQSVHRLEQAGAAAQIYIHDDHLHESTVSGYWGNPTDRTIHLYPRTIGISVRFEDGERLKQWLADGPVEVTVHAEVDTGWRPIPLLLADLPGPFDDFVLFSSHIDSWYFGAMDNGSANATTLETARILAEHKAELRRGLKLAFWSGHSHGRFAGSAWFADHYYHQLAKHCLAHVYCDSTGGQGASVIAPPVMPETQAFAHASIEAATGEKPLPRRIGRFADQSFYGIGVASIYGTFSEQPVRPDKNGIVFGEGGGLGWWWHTPDDTVDKVDKELLVRDTKAYVLTMYRLLSSPLLPFDYRAAMDDLTETVDHLASVAGNAFDFTRLKAKLHRLHTLVTTFYERLDEAAVDTVDQQWVDTANGTILGLSRHIVPINFHENGRFDHDPATALQPLPSLQPVRQLAAFEARSEPFFLLYTRLIRQQNWVLEELDAAAAVVEKGLAVLTE